MPEVSVIIPNYNHSVFLGKRIQSVLDQTYQDFEIIILDDKSSDDSLDVIYSFKENQKIARIIVNKENSGSTFKQWNKGIKEASGKFIWLAESDDYADPRFLESLVPFLKENPEAGLAISQSVIIDEKDQFLKFINEIPDEGGNRIFNGKEFTERFMMIWNYIPNASAVVFRKSLFMEVEGANEQMRLCADWLLWVKMLAAANIYVNYDYLNYYRKHTNNVRSKTNYLTFIHEHFSILLFIKSRMQGSQLIINEILDTRIAEWLKLLGNEFTKKQSLSLSLKLYKQLIQLNYTKALKATVFFTGRSIKALFRNRIPQKYIYEK